MAAYNGGAVTYTYDGDSKRVKKAAGSPSQYDRLYWYGFGGQVLAESDLSGTIISEYIWFGGSRIARRDVATSNVYYYVTDQLGNASIVTSASGTVVEESDFYPFGIERPIVNNLDNNYKFTGHERDAESGLDHTLYRQLSSAQARWLSPDPVRGQAFDPQSWNRYSYVENNPCGNIDPDGAITRVLRTEPAGSVLRWLRFPTFDDWDWGVQKTAQDILDEIQDRADRPTEDLAYAALGGLVDRMDTQCAEALGFGGNNGVDELRDFMNNSTITLGSSLSYHLGSGGQSSRPL